MLGIGISMTSRGVTSSGESFSPTDIAGLAGWYISDTGFVAETSWEDQSEAGNDLTVSGATVGSDLNGRATVSFDGTNDGATRDVFNLGAAGAVSIFVVCKINVGNIGRQVIAMYGDGAFDCHGFGGNPTTAHVINGVLSENGTTNLSSAWNVVGTIQTDDASTDYLYVNNAAEADQAGVGNVADDLLFALGRYTGAAEWCKCQIAEVVVYAAALSSDDRAALQTYFEEQWGL